MCKKKSNVIYVKLGFFLDVYFIVVDFLNVLVYFFLIYLWWFVYWDVVIICVFYEVYYGLLLRI